MRGMNVKKIPQIFCVLLLIGAGVLNSGCNSQQVQKDTIVCLGNATIDEIVAVASENWEILLGIAPSCLPVVADTFTSSNPDSNTSNSSSVALSETSPEGAAEISWSPPRSDCIALPALPTFDFPINLTVSIPLAMIVGSKGAQSTFSAKPSGTSNNEL